MSKKKSGSKQSSRASKQATVANSPSRSAKKAAAGPASTDDPASEGTQAVDRVLIALQKTLSRVSRDSAAVGETNARALIVGGVGFEIELKCSLAAGDKLVVDNANGSPLKLSGEIISDVGVRVGKDNARG